MIEIETVEHIVIAVIVFLILFNIYLNYNKIKNDTAEMILEFLIMSFILTISVHLINLIFIKSATNNR